MANSHAKLLVVAVTLAVLLIGSAEATKKCPKWHKDCNPRKPGCETCVEKDVNNCGDCGKKCKTLPYTWTWCAGGQCLYKCKDGFGNCDNNLWSNGCETCTSNDAKNCGYCGKACKQVPYAAASNCVKGKCCEPVCHAGRGNCDKNIWSNGCEVDLAMDVKNCGTCGNKCPDTLVGGEPYCSSGECKNRCKAGNRFDETTRGCVPITAPPPPGCEADLTSDVGNCGTCGNKCPDTLVGGEPYCSNGVCSNRCKAGNRFDEASRSCIPITAPPPPGCEADLTSDVENCGTCGNKCPDELVGGEPYCSNGVCSNRCKAGNRLDEGFGGCVPITAPPPPGCEADLTSDALNCGTCGNVCPNEWPGGEPYCSNGVCSNRCKAGERPIEFWFGPICVPN